MASKIPRSVFAALAQKVRDDPDKLRNLAFGDSTTSLTAVKTRDLRFDVHKNTQDPNMATGIIQANSEAHNGAVEAFIKGRTGGHKGTHQVIGDKIRFHLGSSFDVDAVANAIEGGGDGNLEASTSAITASSATGISSGWTWSAEYSQYYRVRSDGTYEWSMPATEDGEWTWSSEHRRYYRRKANGTYEWQ